jgi:hypothetical protein
LGSFLSFAGEITGPTNAMCAVSLGFVEIGYLVVASSLLALLVKSMRFIGSLGKRSATFAMIAPPVAVVAPLLAFFALVENSRCYDVSNAGFSASWLILVVLWIAIYFGLRKSLSKLEMVRVDIDQQELLICLMKVSLLASCLMAATYIIFAIKAIPYATALVLLAVCSCVLSIFIVVVLRVEILGNTRKPAKETVTMGPSSSLDVVKLVEARDAEQPELVQVADVYDQPTIMYPHTSEEETENPDVLSADQVAKLRQHAFLISTSSLTGFEEYVDRTTGDSFWIDPVRRTLRFDNPQVEIDMA